MTVTFTGSIVSLGRRPGPIIWPLSGRRTDRSYARSASQQLRPEARSGADFSWGERNGEPQAEIGLSLVVACTGRNASRAKGRCFVVTFTA
jgi:hypothetical protein